MESEAVSGGRIRILKTFTENRAWRGEYEDESVNLSWDEGRDNSRAKRTTHLACLVEGMSESLPFFSIAYTGPDAQKVFKQDCLRYSRNRYGNVAQLRGFNDSDIPMVLFHEELIPVQHIQRHHKYSTALQCYLSLQASIAKKNLPEWCPTEWISYYCKNVWIQPRNGRISFGPAGPRPDFFHVDPHWYPAWQLASCSDIPVLHPATYSADRITEYLFKYCSDQLFLDLLDLTRTRSNMYPKTEDWPRHTCHVWDRFSGRPLARFRSGWTYKTDYSWHAEWYLHPITMEDGRIRLSINSTSQGKSQIWTRFQFNVDIPWHQECHGWHGWLSQACSIFNTLNIPKDKWSDYHFIDELVLYLDLCTFDHDVEDDFDTIAPNINEHDCYLFLHPPPRFPGGFPDIHAWMSGNNLYYYSLDPNGKSVMTESQRLSCRPPPIIANVNTDGRFWNSDVYDLISAWQEKKGFDPTTTGFARSLALPIMEVIYSADDGHFEDLFEDTYSTSPYTDGVGIGDEGAMDVDSRTPHSHLQNNGSAFSRFRSVDDEDVEMMVDDVDDSLFMDTDWKWPSDRW
ncbi:hypothetical protein E1B28_011994 [Marasmius oreades]|uniref:Uncharacterized protein n=1 Tax=Marasmius oreades TaxID=181124 RepID=A0A9P7RRJ5_9AGAR|nr:uncharacterized protein E1B28_011994 [Marasmius oreades]KAG7087951.1 hypothetical protein E1B28_011994 [Marasmius oreades]